MGRDVRFELPDPNRFEKTMVWRSCLFYVLSFLVLSFLCILLSLINYWISNF